MHNTCGHVYACKWHCILVKSVRFYICHEPVMTSVVVDDTCMARDGLSMVEDDDDVVASDRQKLG